MKKKVNDKLTDEISKGVSLILETENELFVRHPREIAALQVEQYSHEDFLKTKTGLLNMGNDFSIHFAEFLSKYSYLCFGKEFISDGSPLVKLWKVDSTHWTSFEELTAAIDKIKSTNMAQFDEDILIDACILHLRIKFMKNILGVFIVKSSEILKQSTKRINNLKSKSTVTNDTIMRDYLEASIDKATAQMNIGQLLNPLTPQSPTRKILSPKKIGLYVFDILELANPNIYGKISFKEGAKKQRVYMSAIDLIQILRPGFMNNFEEIQEIKSYENKDITLTKTLYFKKYAQKRILETGLFV